MRVTKIIIYSILGLLVVVVAYSLYVAYQNSAEKTVKKVLELRDDFEKNKDEIKNYMTAKYFDYKKGDDPQINSSKCQLSSYKYQGRVAVLCRIQTARGNEMKNEDAAIFYLVRSGLYPFSHRYQIDDIEVVDPALVETFSDIIVKKEVQSESFGRAFDAGSLSLLFDDYKCEIKESEDVEGEVKESALYSFVVRETEEKSLKDTPMFFEMIGKDNVSLTSIAKASENKGDSEVGVRMVSFDQGCDAVAVNMQSGKLDMKYKVNIK